MQDTYSKDTEKEKMTKEEAMKKYEAAIKAIREDPKAFTPEEFNVIREAALGGMTKEQMRYLTPNK